ncbi:DUF1003 domain-containing protein [Kribbella qitaiheensis]|uniref:DUF1003 domain-containing protein n=1 Tax=Kribbella qitaiheensis TaxID=1544730 RepID=A0A7G6WSL3_9ACTN|nr:DUF1003 domain-containing protein [Kribbella qitaiheensis]
MTASTSPPRRRPDLIGSGGHHPVVVAHQRARAADLQLRVADAITAFAGSMTFVYLHGGLFALWMLVFEADPWPKLTLIVSLEAIFLSAFVMIGQNRQSAFQQAKADHDFVAQEQELRTNTELTREIHRLTAEIHRSVVTARRCRKAPVVRTHACCGQDHDCTRLKERQQLPRRARRGGPHVRAAAVQRTDRRTAQRRRRRAEHAQHPALAVRGERSRDRRVPGRLPLTAGRGPDRPRDADRRRRRDLQPALRGRVDGLRHRVRSRTRRRRSGPGRPHRD